MPEWTKCADLDFENDDSVNWTYCASFPAAVLFAVLFFIFTVAQIVQAFMFRKVCRLPCMSAVQVACQTQE